jgi:hypothetical protein
MLSILYVIKHNAQVKLYFGIMPLTMVFLDIQGCRYTLANVSGVRLGICFSVYKFKKIRYREQKLVNKNQRSWYFMQIKGHNSRMEIILKSQRLLYYEEITTMIYNI